MSFLLEFLFGVVFEFAAYGVGRAVLLVVAPHCGVELQSKSPLRSWSWRGFSFVHNRKRYFYIETVQLTGLATIAALVILVVVLYQQLK